VVYQLLNTGSRSRMDDVMRSAVIAGDEQLCDAILACNIDVNAHDFQGYTYLIWCGNNSSNEAHLRIAEKLIAHGADVNAPSEQGIRPLHCAVSSRFRVRPQVNYAEFLLQHGAKLNVRDSGGATPLLHAAREGECAMLDLLLAHATANDLQTKDDNDSTLLHAAAANWHEPSVCQYFLDKGFDCHAKNRLGKTPLFYAVTAPRIAIDNTNKLLNAGARIDETDNKGKTPLFYAARHSDSAVLQFLIEHGANVNHADMKGKTPLYNAIKNRKFECAVMLLNNGAKADLSVNGKTLLQLLESNPCRYDEYHQCVKMVKEQLNIKPAARSIFGKVETKQTTDDVQSDILSKKIGSKASPSIQKY
jgi:ankyrin repeat protein